MEDKKNEKSFLEKEENKSPSRLIENPGESKASHSQQDEQNEKKTDASTLEQLVNMVNKEQYKKPNLEATKLDIGYYKADNNKTSGGDKLKLEVDLALNNASSNLSNQNKSQNNLTNQEKSTNYLSAHNKSEKDLTTQEKSGSELSTQNISTKYTTAQSNRPNSTTLQSRSASQSVDIRSISNTLAQNNTSNNITLQSKSISNLSKSTVSAISSNDNRPGNTTQAQNIKGNLSAGVTNNLSAGVTNKSSNTIADKSASQRVANTIADKSASQRVANTITDQSASQRVANSQQNTTKSNLGNIPEEGEACDINNHDSRLNRSESNNEEAVSKDANTSTYEDPSIVLGAACVFSNRIPELLKDIKKNTKTASTFDVFIVNDEGKINSYEINHYVEDEINNQLYNTIKTPAEKKRTYQDKLRNIVNVIKESKHEPIKESEPTILEISHLDDIKDNVLVLCYCGNGICSDKCKCIPKKNPNTEEEEENQPLSPINSSFEDNSFISKSVFDSSYENSLSEEDEIADQVKAVDNKLNSQSKDLADLKTSKNEDKKILTGTEEHIIGDKDKKNSCLQYIANQSKLNEVFNENLNNLEQEILKEENLQNKDKKDSYNECTMRTQSVIDALNINKSDVVVKDLIEHNSKLLNKECTVIDKNKPLGKIEITKAELSDDDSSEIIILHEDFHHNDITDNLKQCISDESKPSTLSDFDIKTIQKEPSIYGVAVPQVKIHENISLQQEKNDKVPINNKNKLDDKQLSDELSSNLSIRSEGLRVLDEPAISNASKQSSLSVAEPSNKVEEQTSICPETAKDDELQAKESQAEVSKTNETEKQDKNKTGNETSTSLIEPSQSKEQNQPTNASHVEIEIHLATNNSAVTEREVTNTVYPSNQSNNSTITFIENDKGNYSTTLQNIRKNRVGNLVKYFEELEKKSKENSE